MNIIIKKTKLLIGFTNKRFTHTAKPLFIIIARRDPFNRQGNTITIITLNTLQSTTLNQK